MFEDNGSRENEPSHQLMLDGVGITSTEKGGRVAPFDVTQSKEACDRLRIESWPFELMVLVVRMSRPPRLDEKLLHRPQVL